MDLSRHISKKMTKGKKDEHETQELQTCIDRHCSSSPSYLKYTCKVCHKTFSCKSILGIHEKTHAGNSRPSPPKGSQTQAGIPGPPPSKGQHTQPGFSGTPPRKGSQTHAGISEALPFKGPQTKSGFSGPPPPKGLHTRADISSPLPPKGLQMHISISRPLPPKSAQTLSDISQQPPPPKGLQTHPGISGSLQIKGPHTSSDISGQSLPKGPQTYAGTPGPLQSKGPQIIINTSRPPPPMQGPQVHPGISEALQYKRPQTLSGPPPPKGLQTFSGIFRTPHSRGPLIYAGIVGPLPPKGSQINAGISDSSPPKHSQTHADISKHQPSKGPRTHAGIAEKPMSRDPRIQAGISGRQPSKGPQTCTGVSGPSPAKGPQIHADISEQPPPDAGIARKPLSRDPRKQAGISGCTPSKGLQTNSGISQPSLPKVPQTYAGISEPLSSKGPQSYASISGSPIAKGPQNSTGISGTSLSKDPHAGISQPPSSKGPQTHAGISRSLLSKGPQIQAGISEPLPSKGLQTHAGIAGLPPPKCLHTHDGTSGPQLPKGPQTPSGISRPLPYIGSQNHAGISRPSLSKCPQTHAGISGLTPSEGLLTPTSMPGPSPIIGPYTHAGVSEFPPPKDLQTNTSISGLPSPKSPQMHPGVSRSSSPKGPQNHTYILGSHQAKGPQTPARVPGHPQSKSQPTTDGISGSSPSKSPQTPANISETQLTKGPQTHSGKIKPLPPKSLQTHADILGPTQPPAGNSGSSLLKRPHTLDSVEGPQPPKIPKIPARISGSPLRKGQQTHTDTSKTTTLKDLQTTAGISGMSPPKGPQTPTNIAGPSPPKGLQTPTSIAGSSPPKGPQTPTSIPGLSPPKGPQTPTSIAGPSPPKGPQTPASIAEPSPPKGPQTPTSIAKSSPPKGPQTPTSIAKSSPPKGPQTPTSIAGSSPHKDSHAPAGISEPTPHTGLQTYAGASEPLPSMCSVSSMQFETNSSCKEDLQQVHGAGDIQKEGEINKCNICSKQFQTQLALKCHFHFNKSKDTSAQHMPSDKETKAYACPQCDFKTNSQGSMRNHLRRHYTQNQTGHSVAPKQRSSKKTKLGVDASKLKASSKGDNDEDKKKTRNTKNKPRKDLLPRTFRNEGISKDNKVIKPKPQRKTRKNKPDKDPYKFSSDDASEPQSKSVVTKAKQTRGKGVRKSKTITAKAKAVRSKVGKVRQRKGKTDPHQCSYCKIAFKSKVHLKYHIFFCEPAQNKVYICSICGRRHRLKWKLDKHMLLAHGDSSQAQDFTDTAAFTSPLKDHEVESSVSQPLTEISAERNLLSNELMRHEQSLGKLCTCTICGLSFSTDLLLGVHVMTMHPKSGEKETDDACISSSNNTHSYQKTASFDYLMDTSDEKLTSDMFPKEFDIYTCDICGSNFTQRMHIEKHIRNHLNVHSSTQNTADLSEKEKGIEYAIPETAQGDIVSLNTNNDRAPTLEQHISFKLMPSESILKLYLALSREDRNLLRKRIKEEFSLSMYLVDASEMSGPDSHNHVCLVCMAKFTKHQNLTRHILYKPFEHVLYFEGKPNRVTADAQSLGSHMNMPAEMRVLQGTKLSATCLKVMQEFISMVLNKMTFFKNIGISEESLTVLMDSTEPTSLSSGQSKLQIVKDIMRLSGTTAVERQIYDSFSDSFPRTCDSLLQGKSQGDDDDDDEHDDTDEEKDNPPSSVDNRQQESKMDTNDSTDSAISRYEEDIYEECPQLTPQTMLSDNIETADQIDIKTEVYVDMDMGEDAVDTSTDANMNRNESNCISEQLAASKEQNLGTDELTEPLISKPPSEHEHFRVLKTEPIFTEVPTEEAFSDAPDMDRMIGLEPAEHPSSQPANAGDLISQVSTENIPGSASNIEQLIMKPYCYMFEPLIKQIPLEDTTPLDDTSSCHSDEGDVMSQTPMMQDSFVVGTAKPTTHQSTEHNRLSGAPSTESLTKPALTEDDSAVAFNIESLNNQSPQDNTSSMEPNTEPPINQSTSEDMPSIPNSHTTTSNDCDEGNMMCPHCETVIHVGQKTVKCHLCCFKYCIACSHLSSDVQSQMEKASEYESGYVWMCAVCRPLLPRLAVIMTNLGDLEHGLNNRLSDLERKVSGIQQVFRESRPKDP